MLPPALIFFAGNEDFIAMGAYECVGVFITEIINGVLGITAQFSGNGGMDVFNAGLGTDSILINASNIAALEQTGTGNRARVNGGGGVDTLKLDGADLTLDLTTLL
jgi:hypothetical protein